MAVPLQRIMRGFNDRIEEPVRKHLKNVYGCLMLSSASAALGVYLNVYAKLIPPGFFTFLPAIGLLLALQFTLPDGKNNKLRLSYLLGFALFTGMNMTPLINYAIFVNPSIIVSALIGTVLLFTCFTLSVMFARRGYWLFIAGPISTILSTLLLLSLGNIFFGSKMVEQLNIYVGLLVFCGYVLYDTTIIMEKCRMNDKDYISHSINLFSDFIAIFQNLLIIFSEAEQRGRRSEENRNKRK